MSAKGEGQRAEGEGQSAEPLEPPARPMPFAPSALPARRFAHPVEEEFARLLDFYHVRWEYEPRSFPLEWDAAGNLKACFTPDFYLVDQDLYVELTTMSARLQNRKNRKVRALQSLYPDVRIRLFTQRDVRNLARHYALKTGLGLPPNMPAAEEDEATASE